jgi:hypothetical protein
MHFAAKDGTLSAPMVVKHWRQDWQYQDTEMHAFQGNGVFVRQGLDATATEGTWTQTVYQVDDSPRYEAIGRWTHTQGVSFGNQMIAGARCLGASSVCEMIIRRCLDRIGSPLRLMAGPRKRTH